MIDFAKSIQLPCFVLFCFDAFSGTCIPWLMIFSSAFKVYLFIFCSFMIPSPWSVPPQDSPSGIPDNIYLKIPNLIRKALLSHKATFMVSEN